MDTMKTIALLAALVAVVGPAAAQTAPLDEPPPRDAVREAGRYRNCVMGKLEGTAGNTVDPAQSMVEAAGTLCGWAYTRMLLAAQIQAGNARDGEALAKNDRALIHAELLLSIVKGRARR